MNASSGSYLACCLPPNAPPGSGAIHPHLGERQADQVRDDPLQPVRVLDRAPDRDAVAIGRRHEGVRLDRELRDHRERVGALGDDVRLARRGVEVAPAVAVLAEDVASRRAGRPAGCDGSWTSGCPVRQRGGERCRRPAAPRRRRGRAAPPPRPRRASRPRPPPPARRGTSSRRRRAPDGRAAAARSAASAAGRSAAVITSADARDGQRRASVDLPDPGAGSIERDELHVQDVVEIEVRDVLLPPVTRPMPPTRAGDVPTLPVIAVRRRRPESMLDPPTPAPGRAPRRPPGRRSADRGRRDHRLDDLLVAGAAAQVAGEPSSISARVGCGVSARSAVAGDQLARDAEAALHGARVSGTPAGAGGACRRRPGPRRS